MRDRLIEIVDKSKEEYANDVTDHTETEYIVEGLLNKGAILPPCKVGETVYVIDKKHKCEACIKKTVCCDKFCKAYRSNDLGVREASVYAATLLNGEDCMELTMHASVHGNSEQYGYSIEFMEEDICKTVFLTREEAEQALKGDQT